MLRPVLLLRTALAAVLLLLLTAVPAAAAGDPIMPLSQVQRGMQCTGYTVIRGTDITSFDAVVQDVVYDGSGTAAILTTISGPAVDSTGAGPGFSGSPVYCPSPADGTPQVIGALAFGIGAFDNKTLLLTPIEAMLGDPVAPPASARRATAAERRARPLAPALSLSGLSPAVAGVFRTAARRAGRTLYVAPAAGRATAFAVQTLRPGSAVAAGFSSGDIKMGGIGTVTYVDGNDVWAFGHPLDSVGRRSLFLQDAYVYGVIGSPAVFEQSTYKLAAAGHDIGTLSGDGVASIAGTMGPLPPRVPLTVTAYDLDRDTDSTLRVVLADERAIGNPTGFSPLGFVGSGAVAQAAYQILQGSPLNSSGEMCVSFEVAEREKPMGFCNTYVAAGVGLATEGGLALLGAPEVADFANAASILDSYKLGPLTLTAVNVTIGLRRGLAQAFMTRMTGPKRVRRGEDATVKLFYKRPGGEGGSLTLEVPIPAKASRGPRELVLAGTPSDLAGGALLDESLLSLFGGGNEAGPRNLEALAGQIERLHRYDGITFTLQRRRHKKGRALVPGKPKKSNRVHRDPDLRYSGVVGLEVVVR